MKRHIYLTLILLLVSALALTSSSLLVGAQDLVKREECEFDRHPDNPLQDGKPLFVGTPATP